MKKKFNVALVVAIVLLTVNAIAMVNIYQRMGIVEDQQTENVARIESVENDVQTIEEQLSQYSELLPFNSEKAEITEICNKSDLKSDETFPERHFLGTISLSWKDIPNASGYQVEFNYQPILEETEKANYFVTGAFYSYKVDISNGLKFRIRAYGQQNGEKVYGEFSDWISLDVE